MLAFKTIDGKLICSFPPRMDTAACQICDAELAGRIAAAGRTVVFDLSGVGYVSSAFLRLCLAAFKKVGAGNFSLIHVGSEVKKVLKIAGLDEFLARE